jgi:predicted nicotinamide N-methyase
VAAAATTPRTTSRAPAVEIVEERIDLGTRTLRIARPRDPEELIDVSRFDVDEYMPYWAQLWPSGIALATFLGEEDLTDLRVLELGCGLGLPSIAAALAGAHVLATDWSEDAVVACADNARRNGVEIETLVCSWDDPAPLLTRAPYDLVLAADVLYERRNVEPLLDVLPRLARDVLLAEPGRPYAKGFFESAATAWDVTEPAGRVYRLRPRTA